MLLSAKNLSNLNIQPDLGDSNPTNKNSTQSPYILYALFIIIYISGGFTNAGIFPKFENYTFIAKYYNVQPLFLTVIFAGILADKVGRKAILYIGFGMVGLSFTTFMLPVSYNSYFLTQTFTQIGWGFVNTFVWVVSADLSIRLGKPKVAARGVACMLFGTVLGAITAHLFNQANLTQDALYAVATLAPLFVGLILISLIPETFVPNSTPHNVLEINTLTNAEFQNDVTSYSAPKYNESLHLLTTREQEVALLLAKNHTRQEICDILNISINTLKTHIRHIYRKLEVKNKDTLRRRIEK